MAAGDWRYYRVWLPTNMPDRWSIALSKQQGDVVLYLRDQLPPSQGRWTGEFLDWAADVKNHGPYPAFNTPGTYTLTVPPVRPGLPCYLGVRAVSDAIFSLASAPGSAVIALDGLLPFRDGYVTNQLPPGGSLRYRVAVPPEGRRWISTAVHASSVRFYLDQGTLPTVTAADHWLSSGANSTLNRVLYGGSWPWLPGYLYYLTVTNTAATSQPFSFRLDGRDCGTDDFDGDGLLDCWEIQWFGSITAYGAADDPDDDGLSNLLEQQLGTNPTRPDAAVLLNPVMASNGTFSFSSASRLGRTNRVEVSTTLTPGSWTPLVDYVQTAPIQVIIVSPPPQPMRFFRVRSQ